MDHALVTSYGLMMDPIQVNHRELEGLQQAIDAEIKSLEESIFSFLRLPGTSPLSASGEPDHPAWLRVAHVFHHWREILIRAKKAPLHLEANVAGCHWDNARFSAFEKELQLCISHIYHLCISSTDARILSSQDT